jgi:hypothetical protein
LIEPVVAVVELPPAVFGNTECMMLPHPVESASASAPKAASFARVAERA